MKLDVLCTDPNHPVIPVLKTWCENHAVSHEPRLINDVSELRQGDILFLVSCSQLVTSKDRELYRHVMVLHASDLPTGRGWSPHVWDILAGKEELTLSLLVAEDKVDSGDIWAKHHFTVPKHALYDEINDLLFQAEVELMDHAIDLVEQGEAPKPQDDRSPSYHPRRTPADSELDSSSTLESVFNQLRVADPDRFPAFFRMHGHDFELTVKKRGK